MPLVYFKDRFIPEAECLVPISDRSFRFGDGVFETFLVHNGRIYDFAHHEERLRKGLAAFRIELDVSALQQLCNEVIAKNNLKEGYIRAVVSRGSNGANAVGYLPKDTAPWLLIQPIEKPYPAFRSLTLWQSSHPASVHTPSKTNNALIYTLAMMEADEQGCDNALMLTNQGIICETASGNIFWVKDSVLYTPAIDLPMVPGTMRRRVLELWNGPKQEGHFGLEQLQQADEVFMTNIASIAAAVVALQPVGFTWPVGPHTKQLREALDKDIFMSCSKVLENH